MNYPLPFPEPPFDIAAQLRAVMEPEHPKVACYVVPDDADEVPLVLDAYIERRDEGVLVTRNEGLAITFCDAKAEAFDRTMADILGYPEDKGTVVKNCGDNFEGLMRFAIAVQARDVDGNVITEAYASPHGLDATIAALEPHGMIVRLTPLDAMHRRVTRRQEQRNG